MKASVALTVIGRRRTAQRVSKAGIGPTDLHQQIVGSSQCGQPALHCPLSVLDTGSRAEALGRDSANHRQRILDAMMKLPEDELLQFVGGLSLLGIDAGLDK